MSNSVGAMEDSLEREDLNPSEQSRTFLELGGSSDALDNDPEALTAALFLSRALSSSGIQSFSQGQALGGFTASSFVSSHPLNTSVYSQSVSSAAAFPFTLQTGASSSFSLPSDVAFQAGTLDLPPVATPLKNVGVASSSSFSNSIQSGASKRAAPEEFVLQGLAPEDLAAIGLLTGLKQANESICKDKSHFSLQELKEELKKYVQQKGSLWGFLNPLFQDEQSLLLFHVAQACKATGFCHHGCTKVSRVNFDGVRFFTCDAIDAILSGFSPHGPESLENYKKSIFLNYSPIRTIQAAQASIKSLGNEANILGAMQKRQERGSLTGKERHFTPEAAAQLAQRIHLLPFPEEWIVSYSRPAKQVQPIQKKSRSKKST